MVTDNAYKFCISEKYPSILLSTPYYKPQLECCGSVATCPALPGTSSMSYKSCVPRQQNSQECLNVKYVSGEYKFPGG